MKAELPLYSSLTHVLPTLETQFFGSLETSLNYVRNIHILSFMGECLLPPLLNLLYNHYEMKLFVVSSINDAVY